MCPVQCEIFDNLRGVGGVVEGVVEGDVGIVVGGMVVVVLLVVLLLLLMVLVLLLMLLVMLTSEMLLLLVFQCYRTGLIIPRLSAVACPTQ